MMSADTQAVEQMPDIVLGGSPVPARIKPGEIDPLSRHYFYSAGERELKTRARDVGYASILPGYLVKLDPFRINIPNDKVETLFDRNAPQQIEEEVRPLDQADALMSRYQHRGGRILFPLTGMEGKSGLQRAVKLFTAVHPPIVCSHKPKDLQRAAAGQIMTCVFCRLEDLRSESWMQRVVAAKVSEREDIAYGVDPETQEPRLISEETACEIIHGLMLSANEELFVHMIDTLQQSKADVEAGRMGPGKKKYDKRDEWYFLNTHTSADQIQAAASVSGREIAEIVSETIKGVRENAPAVPPQIDVAAVIEQQNKKIAELERKLKTKSKQEPES
jgi:hypothetical protein